MTLCYLALGSNLKNPQRQLRHAIHALRGLHDCDVLQVAGFYASKAWGRKVQPSFYNTVVSIRTRLTPEQLLARCQQIEIRQGRYRRVKWGARTIDIDILLYGQRQINQPQLTIPHPSMMARDFVLIPLLEIAPEIVLPNTRKVVDLSRHISFCRTIERVTL